MTIDEAIQHCEEVAKEQESHGYCDRSLCVIMDANNATCDECEAVKCRECASEHRQLAEWLKELKTLKVSRKELLNDIDMAIKASNMDDAYSVGLRNGMRVIKVFIDDEEPEYEKCCHEESRSEIPNTCEDAISRQAVLDIITFEDKWLFDANGHNANTHIAFSGLESRIKALPPVTPQQKMGRWIKTPKAVMGEGYMWYCDKCEHQVYQDNLKSYPSEKYCPNCGAKMESEDKEEKTGRWIYGEDNLGTGRDGWYCNQCGHFEFWDYSSNMKGAKLNLPNPCPNCGAKMEVKE